MFVSCLERLRLVSLFLPAFVKSFSPILSGGFRARGTAPITSRIYAHSCHPSCRCVLFHRIAKKFISAAGPQSGSIRRSFMRRSYAPLNANFPSIRAADDLRSPPFPSRLGRGGRGRSEPAINLPICSRVVAHIFARTNGTRDAKMEEEMERTDEGKMVEDGEGRRGGKGR